MAISFFLLGGFCIFIIGVVVGNLFGKPCQQTHYRDLPDIYVSDGHTNVGDPALVVKKLPPQVEEAELCTGRGCSWCVANSKPYAVGDWIQIGTARDWNRERRLEKHGKQA